MGIPSQTEMFKYVLETMSEYSQLSSIGTEDKEAAILEESRNAVFIIYRMFEYSCELPGLFIMFKVTIKQCQLSGS